MYWIRQKHPLFRQLGTNQQVLTDGQYFLFFGGMVWQFQKKIIPAQQKLPEKSGAGADLERPT